MSPQNKSMRLKKLIGEKVTFALEPAEGDNKTISEVVQIIDVGEKSVWITEAPGLAAKPYEFWRIREVTMNLEEE